MNTVTKYHDTVSGFTWLDFGSRPDEATITALKSAGWRWGSKRKQWWTNARRPTFPPGYTVEDGGPVDYAAERADRLATGADNARARSTQHHAAAHEITDGIPLGQPILLGHHSEGRHRRDLARADGHYRHSYEESKKAEELDYRAESSARHQAHKEAPGTIERRIKRLRAEQTAYRNQTVQHSDWADQWKRVPRLDNGAVTHIVHQQYRFAEDLHDFYKTACGHDLPHGTDQTPDPIETQRCPRCQAWWNMVEQERAARLAEWDTQIAEQEALLAAAGGLAADRLGVAVGDRIQYWGGLAVVQKINHGRTGAVSSYTVARYPQLPATDRDAYQNRPRPVTPDKVRLVARASEQSPA